MYSAVLLSSNLPLWREDFRIVYAISDGKLKNKQENYQNDVQRNSSTG